MQQNDDFTSTAILLYRNNFIWMNFKILFIYYISNGSYLIGLLIWVKRVKFKFKYMQCS